MDLVLSFWATEPWASFLLPFFSSEASKSQLTTTYCCNWAPSVFADSTLHPTLALCSTSSCPTHFFPLPGPTRIFPQKSRRNGRAKSKEHSKLWAYKQLSQVRYFSVEGRPAWGVLNFPHRRDLKLRKRECEKGVDLLSGDQVFEW